MNKIKFLVVNFRVDSTSLCYSLQLHVTTTASKHNIYVGRTRDFQLLLDVFKQIPIISEQHHNSRIKQTKKWSRQEFVMAFKNETFHTLTYSALLKIKTVLVAIIVYKIYCTDSTYSVCTKINYVIVPVTNLNKYLHNGTSGTELGRFHTFYRPRRPLGRVEV
jgi:hypothetical protein